MLLPTGVKRTARERSFQWAPTLGGECYLSFSTVLSFTVNCFNGHPPLGVNATKSRLASHFAALQKFQWVPTLGGECYQFWIIALDTKLRVFQWAPTLGGECYRCASCWLLITKHSMSFNGHPPLGVNATPHIGGCDDVPVD